MKDSKYSSAHFWFKY